MSRNRYTVSEAKLSWLRVKITKKSQCINTREIVDAGQEHDIEK